MTVQSVAAAPALHVVRAGAGAPVACLHSSGSSSSQWRALLAAGEATHRLLALDFHGHGRSPGFPGDHYSLGAESDAVLRALPDDRPVHLVGHSYGGAVALHLAVTHPQRFASVTVFEPVLFRLLDYASSEFGEIAAVGLAIVRAANAGESARASEAFIDYWNGPGAWRRLPAEQQERVRDRITPVARHFEALFADPLPWTPLRLLRVPTLVLCGERSPAPARGVCRRLAALPAVRLDLLPGMAHMGPLTHADTVNERILRHIARHATVGLANAA